MPPAIKRVVGMMFLLAVLAACCPPCRPCVSSGLRSAPIYIEPEAFCRLEWQVDCLNHRFRIYETAMDRYAFPKPICKRLIQVDNDLEHVNAELISREVPPQKVQRQIDRIASDLNWIEASTCVARPPDMCCHSPVPSNQAASPHQSWLSAIAKFTSKPGATPKAADTAKSKTQPESKNRAPKPADNPSGPPPNQSTRSQYSDPSPTR